MTNKAKLTKAFVDSCHEAGFYWDTALRGFGLRISGKTKSYIVQARISGKDTRRTIGRHGVYTPEEARKLAKGALAQMAGGVDPKALARAKRLEGMTLQQAFVDYSLQRSLKPSTESDYKSYMTRFFGDWAGKPLTVIKPEMVERRHAQIKEGHGGAQADVAMRFLRAIYNYAEGKYQRDDGEPLIAYNPTKRLTALKLWARPPRRESYIKEDQLKCWYETVLTLGRSLPGSEAETLRDYLLFVLFTGLRRTEAISLRWDYVDFPGRRFTIPSENTKNKTSHALPLTTFTFDLLHQRYESRQSDYVFPGRGRTGHITEPKKAVARIVQASGIAFTIHDLRRTFATCASTVIDNQATVKRLMNHLTGNQDVTEGYKQGVERLRSPAQRVTDYILCLIEKGVPRAPE